MSWSIRKTPPVPPGFEDEFLRGGWRGIEQHFGAPTGLLLRWIDMSGGERLYRARREQLRSPAGPRKTGSDMMHAMPGSRASAGVEASVSGGGRPSGAHQISVVRSAIR